MKTAVIAHYDPDGVWDDNFLLMLSVVAGVVDHVVLVTTAMDMPDLPATHTNIDLIRRPNIGYDFYSYRVGLSTVLGDISLDGVLLLNSSLILIQVDRFHKLLLDMVNDNRTTAVRGVTASKQIAWHLQSYLLYFDLRKLPEQWLQRFFAKVEPVNTKLEVVLAYEIGLGTAISNEEILVDVLFVPELALRCSASIAWMRTLARSAGRYGWFAFRPWKAIKDVNWVHFGANALARQFGFVKAEVLRSNPHRLPLDGIFSACDKQLIPGVLQSIKRTQMHYFGSGNGLTELAKKLNPAEFSYQIIESGLARTQGATVAVVVHLYYLDLLEEILGYLKNIIEPFDLFITTPFEADVRQILNTLEERGQSVTIVLSENRGRDVGPFIALFRSGMLSAYGAVLKLHSKKSRYSEQGSSWRKQLYEPLCGSSTTVLRTLKLLREGEVGIVGPRRFFLSHDNFWGANRDSLARLLISAGIAVSNEGPELGFFAGTMFWFVPHALMAIREISDVAIAFEPEEGKQDGTLAHAWERAFCLLARAAGYRVTALELSSEDIFSINNNKNKVPVLVC
jgi:lipopolysaccharide biosynthesis protein